MNLRGNEMKAGLASGSIKAIAAIINAKTPPPLVGGGWGEGKGRGNNETSSPPPSPFPIKGGRRRIVALSRFWGDGALARLALTALVSVGLAPLLCGCGKPPMLVRQYVLEYPSPPLTGSPLNVAVKVERFAVAQAYNTTSMVYQPGAFKREAYKYHRWRVNPGYQVTDYLVRDLRKSGLFKAVFTFESSEKTRFVLEGGVEDFQELDEADGWKAALALCVTLLDTEQENVARKVVFQKSYRVAEPMVERTPQGLAESMSRAMEKLSAQIITYVYDAARQRLAAKEKP